MLTPLNAKLAPQARPSSALRVVQPVSSALNGCCGSAGDSSITPMVPTPIAVATIGATASPSMKKAKTATSMMAVLE